MDVDSYWSEFFGVEHLSKLTDPILVLPHRDLQGFRGAWIFKKQKQFIFSVPQAELDWVKEYVQRNQTSDFHALNVVQKLFGNRIERIVGPAFQGFMGPGDSLEFLADIQVIDFESQAADLQALASSAPDDEWSNSSIDRHPKNIFGIYVEDQLVAVSNYHLKRAFFGFIGVYTHPLFRGLGYGRRVVQAAIVSMLQEQRTPMYQTLMSNTAAIALAKRLGFIQYGTSLAVRLL